MNKHYSLETRKTVLEMYQAGKPVKEISQQTGASRTHVYEWVKEANLPRQRARNLDFNTFVDCVLEDAPYLLPVGRR